MAGVLAIGAGYGIAKSGSDRFGDDSSRLFNEASGSAGKSSNGDLGASWKPKPPSEVCGTDGCEAVADYIKSVIGGDIMRITDVYSAPQLGKFHGIESGWNYHDVVVRDGRVYDATTERRGEPINEYMAHWEYGDHLVFNPAPR